MVDYYLNIRAKSKSKAPFNLWPYAFKFDLMRPKLIYESFIKADNSIETTHFLSRDGEKERPLQPLEEYSRSTNLNQNAVLRFAAHLGLSVGRKDRKRTVLSAIHSEVTRRRMESAKVADALAREMYLPVVKRQTKKLPKALRTQVEKYVADWQTLKLN